VQHDVPGLPAVRNASLFYDQRDDSILVSGGTLHRIAYAPGLTWFAQPTDRIVELGEAVELRAWPNVSANQYDWQWFKDGVPLAGEFDISLMLTGVTPADAGEYQLRVWPVAEGDPACSYRSNAARVYVSAEACPGDNTGDGVVDALDLNRLLQWFNAACE
jgi:hypothetical protein